MKFSQKSLDRLIGVHPDLVKVCKRAIQLTPIDFGISQGVRTLEEQKRLYAQGRTTPGNIITWTMNSLHLQQKDGWGHAIDVKAYKDGEVSWKEDLYEVIAAVFEHAAEVLKVEIVWGGSWKAKDMPHFELGRKYRL